jgi:hypothetical protein
MLEEVAKAVKACLEAVSGGMADKLDEVETYWSTEGDPLTLPDPQTYVLGGDPDILDYARSAMPVVACLAQEEVPAGKHESRGSTLADQSDQWGYGEASVPASILWWVDADDATTATKYGWRYAKAVKKVLRDSEKLDDGIHVMKYVPSTIVDPPKRQYPDAGGKFYTVMGQITFGVSVRHS